MQFKAEVVEVAEVGTDLPSSALSGGLAAHSCARLLEILT